MKKIHSVKNILRKELIVARNALPEQLIDIYSKIICQHLEELVEYQAASRIAYYYSIHNEVRLNALQKQDHQTFYLPKIIDGQRMIFCKDTNIYQRNAYGIPEPQDSSSLLTEQIDIILLPLVGFDRKGHRLGMGKGFYDRALSNLVRSPLLIGVGFALQERLVIPTEVHDIHLDFIVTEKFVLNCAK